MFVHLHTHSAFSFLEGTFSIPQLLIRLEEKQIPCIALTDTNGLYASVSFYQSAEKIGVKPILGTCIQHDGSEAVLLAQNIDGFAGICRIVTARHLDPEFSMVRELADVYSNVFVLTQSESLLR